MLEMLLSQDFQIEEMLGAFFELGFDLEALASGGSSETEMLPPAETKTEERFASPVTDENIENLIDWKRNQTTTKSTEWAFGIFEISVCQIFLSMDKAEMAFVLDVSNHKGILKKNIYSI